jgi:hypothetical protein
VNRYGGGAHRHFQSPNKQSLRSIPTVRVPLCSSTDKRTVPMYSGEPSSTPNNTNVGHTLQSQGWRMLRSPVRLFATVPMRKFYNFFGAPKMTTILSFLVLMMLSSFDPLVFIVPLLWFFVRQWSFSSFLVRSCTSVLFDQKSCNVLFFL